MNKKAVTILEVLVVLIVIAILSAVAVPTFNAKIERTRGERAIANIQLIADAYKIYAIKNTVNPSAMNSLTEINNLLNLELSDAYFNYDIKFEIIDIPGKFFLGTRIQAIRNNGTYLNKTIRYNLTSSSWDIMISTWPWMP